MEDIGEGPDRRIIRRTNARNVVGQKPQSKLSQITGTKSVRVGAALLGAAGTVGVLSNVNAKSDSDNGVHVTFTPNTLDANGGTSEKVSMSNPENVKDGKALFNTVYHDLDSDQRAQARAEVDKFKGLIAAKSNFKQAHLDIPLEYENVIEQTAKAHGISPEAFMGLIGVENGGGPAVENQISGALGAVQFLPDTARQYGLIVNEAAGIDERADPVKSIAAAGKYLEVSMNLFAGDQGLTIWSYHAGPGNVYHALEVYFKDVNGVDIGNYGEAIAANDPDKRVAIEQNAIKYIKEDKLDIWKLFSNKAVHDQILVNLADYSDTYPASVVALGELIDEYEVQNGLQGGGLEGRTADLGNGLKVKVGDVPSSSPR